jgi:ethanolamine utilization protein EutN
MKLCKVIGTVVSTQKNDELRPAKLLVVKPIALNGAFTKELDIIAIDTSDAGAGDLVLVAQEGAVVEQVMNSTKVPANAIIMGVVDGFEVKET